ncbi:MAG: FIST C-terminal domain-containing protein [Planctomycetia bacterium]|nr:FIST C-terminal domain-containing protein [Planctomycetia bacterium]MCC7313177.1 FIST C-terminal domain-containing protein [Planctomycetota bacterium]
MQFKAALSTLTDTRAAISQLKAAVGDLDPDLVLLFVSPHHLENADALLADVRDKINARNLIGCTAAGIIGGDREVEDAPAISIWAAKLPDVRILPFIIDQQDVTSLEGNDAWRDHLIVSADAKPGFIILPDPFSIDVEHCLSEMDDAYPGSKIVGGLASAGRAPGENRLFLNDQVLRQGLVGVSLSGPIQIDTVVSQGCRPIGEPFVITKAEQNVIQELRGKPALEIVRSVFASASPTDQALMQTGLHVGRVVDERGEKFGQGDFLIRNLMGVVEQSAIAINALIRPGQTIQFQVRDSKSADEEMRDLLTEEIAAMPTPPGGGLLFTCNGRGARMFGKPDHDIGLVNSIAKDCQVAGFFAAGEIGPVGNRTFIHGFTSSLILFRRPG